MKRIILAFFVLIIFGCSNPNTVKEIILCNSTEIVETKEMIDTTLEGEELISESNYTKFILTTNKTERIIFEGDEIIYRTMVLTIKTDSLDSLSEKFHAPNIAWFKETHEPLNQFNGVLWSSYYDNLNHQYSIYLDRDYMSTNPKEIKNEEVVNILGELNPKTKEVLKLSEYIEYYYPDDNIQDLIEGDIRYSNYNCNIIE